MPITFESWMRRQGLRGVRELAGLSILVLTAVGCQTLETPAPGAPLAAVSELAPPPGPLQEAARDLKEGKARELVKRLADVPVKTALERAWYRLLLGEAWLELGVAERGAGFLQQNYAELRDARPAPEPERSRVLARSLRQLGIYYREREAYAEAYTLHQLQLLYMQTFGSLADQHEALLSLDVDAARLRNFFASEHWLLLSLELAAKMPPGMERDRALLLSWNNLALTRQRLERFQEAEAAALEGRRLSQVYDAASQAKEFREVWALAQLADVLGAWARAQEKKDPPASRPLYARAQATAREALLLAARQGLAKTGERELERRMRQHCGADCRAPDTSD